MSFERSPWCDAGPLLALRAVTSPAIPSPMAIRLGLRENLAQFSLLVLVNAFVGAMVGMERSILPLIAEREFHLLARTAILSFIVVFGDKGADELSWPAALAIASGASRSWSPAGWSPSRCRSC